MLAFVVVLQVLVALFMILVVLLQPGNRGGAGAALGGAGGDTVFGGRGANTFLAKLTFGAAVCFMVTNLALSYMSSPANRGSVTDILQHGAPTAPAQAPEKEVAPPQTGEPQGEGIKAEPNDAPKAEENAPPPEGEGAKENGAKANDAPAN